MAAQFTFLQLAIATTLVATLASPALGQPPADQRSTDLGRASLEELFGMEVDQVYSASRFIQDARRAPASVSVITADDVRRFGFRTLAEALRSVTGFYTTSDRNYTYLGVRGFGLPGDYNSRVLVLVDGFRYNDSVYNQALLADEFPVDVSLIERIEIIRGPSSSLYGSNALFAVVNVMTTRGQARRGVEVQADAGSLGAAAGRVSAGGRTSAGLEYLLSETVGGSHGNTRLEFPAIAGAARGVATNMDGEQYENGFAKVSRGGFSAAAGWVSRTKHVPTAAFDTVFGDSSFETTDGRFFAHAEYGRALAPGTDVVGRLSVDAMRYSGTYPYEGESGSYYQDDEARSNGWTGEVMVTHHLRHGHALTAGVQATNDFSLKQYYSYSNGESGLDSSRALGNWGLFVQDEFSISRDLLVNAGGRVDHYGSFGTTVDPRLALIVGPTRRSTVKLLYGRAFRAPTPYELFYWPDQQPLSAETMTQQEVVWEQQIGEHLRSSISVYHNSIDDLIVQTTADEATGSMTPIFFANRSHAVARGADTMLEMKFRPGSLVRLGYTYVDIDSRETGQELSNSPWHLAKIAVVVPVGPTGATASAEGEYVGARTTVTGDLVSGHYRQNLSLQVPKVFGNASASLTVQNLFNRRYADPVGEEIAGGTVIQDGRTAVVSVRYRF